MRSLVPILLAMSAVTIRSRFVGGEVKRFRGSFEVVVVCGESVRVSEGVD